MQEPYGIVKNVEIRTPKANCFGVLDILKREKKLDLDSDKELCKFLQKIIQENVKKR